VEIDTPPGPVFSKEPCPFVDKAVVCFWRTEGFPKEVVVGVETSGEETSIAEEPGALPRVGFSRAPSVEEVSV
jgi:hypothetical protein